MSMRIDELIGVLGADLRPVRRLLPPWTRACGWLAAVAGVALVLSCFADLADFAHRLRAIPAMGAAMLGATMTMVLGAVAAFELSLPDRRAGWALLPLPGLALWIGATGLGCLKAWVSADIAPADLAESRHCFVFIVGLSMPLSMLMVVMIRRACPLRPNLTAATGGLAAAAGAATLLNLFHPYDTGATDLAVHLLAVGLVIGANRLLGGRLLSRPLHRPRAGSGL